MRCQISKVNKTVLRYLAYVTAEKTIIVLHDKWCGGGGPGSCGIQEESREGFNKWCYNPNA